MESGTEEKVHAIARGRRAVVGKGVPASGNSDDTWLTLLGQICPVAIFRGDRQGNCLYANERWTELSGLTIEEAQGSGWIRALHPDDTKAVVAELERCRREEVPFRMEYRYRRPDGSDVWILGQSVQERDEMGNVTGYIGTATDTTELHRMQEELQRSHDELEGRVRERTAQFEHMALIVAASADAIISSDLDGRIVSWNAAAEKIFGYRAEEALGESTYMLTPPDLVEEAAQLKARVRAGERVEYLETMRLARSGELIEVGISIFPLRDVEGTMIGTSAIVRDIREQKKTERRLSQLSRRLLRLQDEERRKLARELHDSTGQSLAALSMHLSALQGSSSMSAEKRAVSLSTALELAQGIERDLRTQAYLLHPPLLDERGLSAALRWFVEGFSVRSGVAVRLEIAEDLGRLPDAVELTIFRVIQESLSNVHRHANSSTAVVRVSLVGKKIVLEVRDFGCGLPAAAVEHQGVGIAGMRERLGEIGGKLIIQSSETGTVVTVSIPQ